jgi:hypothetical protein
MSALGVLAVKESVLEVLQVAARDFERRKLLFRAVRPPRKRRLFRIDVRVGQPGFSGGHQAIGHEGAMISGELANDTRLTAIAPRQRK